MRVVDTFFDSVLLVEATCFEDERGFFFENFHEEALARIGAPTGFVLEGHSFSRFSGTIRGLHCQRPPKQQSLNVRVVAGQVLDVLVDVRVGSPTYGMSEQIELSSKNRLQLFIPPGFAHGFCTLSDDVVMLYKMSEYYAPEAECTVLWNDSSLGITWPILYPTCISENDTNAKPLSMTDTKFKYQEQDS